MMAPLSGAIPTAEGMFEALKQKAADVAFLVPSIVQGLAQDPLLLDYCSKHLDAILYCGGDLPSSVGDAVAEKVKLHNQYGASELGLTHQILSEKHWTRKDWKYAQFHPGTGLELRQTKGDMYEVWAVRDTAKLEVQPTFTIFPNLKEYASRDLFSRHPEPEKKDMWSWQARADDIIVFLNGEKTNPISMEQYIASRGEGVAAALVLGAQRFQAALLVEPSRSRGDPSPTERAAFIERLWPTIEEANKDAPSHARISKSHILFTTIDKPMLRAGKGTIQRRGTLDLYGEEIDALFKDADAMAPDSGSENTISISALPEENLTSRIGQAICSITSWKELDANSNFFARGMDSLQALSLVRRLRKELGLNTIALSTVYNNASLELLGLAIRKEVKGHLETHATRAEERKRLRQEILSDMEARLEGTSSKAARSQPVTAEVVILTGSTGSFGGYILDCLIKDPRVSHIYCLNRRSDAQDRQALPAGRYTESVVSPGHVSFLQVDLGQPLFSLSTEEYATLLSTTTKIIHNAWPVNFNLSLSAFLPQLSGLVNLINFAGQASLSPHLLLVSSISSVLQYDGIDTSIPEKIILDDDAPSATGYGESKYLAELLLDNAVRKLEIHASVARVGQIAGAVARPGSWKKNEWFPSLVISSLHLGILPASLGGAWNRIQWAPIDSVASIITDLALQERSPRQSVVDGISASEATALSVFHVRNPHTTLWDDLRPAIAQYLGNLSSKSIEIIPLRDWIQRVRSDVEAHTAGDTSTDQVSVVERALAINPAAKLLEFYQSAMLDDDKKGGEISRSLDLAETLKQSVGLRSMSAVGEREIKKWMHEWFGD